MMKLLLLPFRVIYYLLRAVLFPWYLRWIFRLHWVVYFALALGVGYFAYQEYQTYQFNLLEAELQIADGPPAAIPLSKWSAADNAPYNNEVTIRGIYFTALGSGEFDPLGLKRQFILLADDQGREVKAALVVWPDDLVQLQRQLAAQGSGERIPVTVNGSLNTNSEWSTRVGIELMVMNVPRAQDLVIVEPFIGDRATAIMDEAEKTFVLVEVLSWLAGFLTLFGVGKLAMGAAGSNSKIAGRTPRSLRRAHQETAEPRPVGRPEASPWGTFQPVTTPTSTPADAPRIAPKPKAKAQGPKPVRDRTQDAPPPQPHFKSVFPGGGSGFRFKSADEIILQSFGTLSTLKPPKRNN